MASAAFGADAPADTTADPTAPRTLNDYLALARAANRGIKSAVAEAQAMREHVGVARGYPDPELTYAYTYAGNSPSETEMKGRNELMLSQDIPFFGKRGLRGDVASREADVTARSADAARLDLDYDVKVAFFEYVRASETERVLGQERDLLAQMRDVSLARYASGTALQYEVLKLDVSIAQLDDQVAMSQHDQDMVRARLNELLGQDQTVPLPRPVWQIPEPTPIETAALVDSALARRPEVASARTALEAAELSQQLARKEYWPDFMVGLAWGFGGAKDAAGNQMGDSWRIEAGVDLPIWLGQRRAMSREADARRKSASYGLEAARLRVAKDVEESRHGVMLARERLVRFDTQILPHAEQTYQSAEGGYRAGRVDILNYLDSERELLTMREEYFRVVAELGSQTAALERALGRRE